MTPKRIGIGMSLCLVAIAIIVDGVQFLLTLTVIGVIASPVLTFFAWTTFLIWFALLGVNYFNRGGAARLATMLASVVTELLPVVNAIPALSLGVVLLIFQHNQEVKKQEREQASKTESRPVNTTRTSRLRAANDNRQEETEKAA